MSPTQVSSERPDELARPPTPKPRDELRYRECGVRSRKRGGIRLAHDGVAGGPQVFSSRGGTADLGETIGREAAPGGESSGRSANDRLKPADAGCPEPSPLRRNGCGLVRILQALNERPTLTLQSGGHKLPSRGMQQPLSSSTR